MASGLILALKFVEPGTEGMLEVCFLDSSKCSLYSTWPSSCLLACCLPRPLPPFCPFITPQLGPSIFEVPISLCPCSLDSNFLHLCSSHPPDTGEQEVTSMGHSSGPCLRMPSRASLNHRQLGHSAHIPIALFDKEGFGN